MRSQVTCVAPVFPCEPREVVAQFSDLLRAAPRELNLLFVFQHLLDAVDQLVAHRLGASCQPARGEPGDDDEPEYDGQHAERERIPKLRNWGRVHAATDPEGPGILSPEHGHPDDLISRALPERKRSFGKEGIQTRKVFEGVSLRCIQRVLQIGAVVVHPDGVAIVSRDSAHIDTHGDGAHLDPIGCDEGADQAQCHETPRIHRARRRIERDRAHDHLLGIKLERSLDELLFGLLRTLGRGAPLLRLDVAVEPESLPPVLIQEHDLYDVQLVAQYSVDPVRVVGARPIDLLLLPFPLP